MFLVLASSIRVNMGKEKWATLIKYLDSTNAKPESVLNLVKAKVLLIRNEPPFDQQYINTTFILEHIVKKLKIIAPRFVLSFVTLDRTCIRCRSSTSKVHPVSDAVLPQAKCTPESDLAAPRGIVWQCQTLALPKYTPGRGQVGLRGAL